ncbi:MAG: DUF4846 domain-containing protein [Bacteroidia bacterium]
MACGPSHEPQVQAEKLIVDTTITCTCATDLYAWLKQSEISSCISCRIGVPKEFSRVAVASNSFGAWLQNLPLLPENSPVLLFNGNEKRNQQAQFAVLDIDVGNVDLQQCADAVMRLRAEYLFASKKYEQIHFNYTSGHRLDYQKWCLGERLKPAGNKVNRVQTGKRVDETDHKNIRAYMNDVFMYAGTLSLSRELKTISIDSVQIGDVFIRGGSPGHAVLVVDMIQNKTTGEKRFMLVQSYMPAQQIHVLKNPNAVVNSPWFSIPKGNTLETPEWDFATTELMRF